MLQTLGILTSEYVMPSLYSVYYEWCINACTKIFFLSFITRYSYEANSGHIPFIALIFSNLIFLVVVFLLRKPTNHNIAQQNIVRIAMSFEIIQLGLLFGLILSWLCHSFLYYEITSRMTPVSQRTALRENIYYLTLFIMPPSFLFSLMGSIFLNISRKVLSIRLFKSIVFSFIVAVVMSVFVMGIFNYLNHPSFTPEDYANQNIEIKAIL
jgi:hypothetical protein